MITTGERQYGTLDEIRRDHIARYEFVTNLLFQNDEVLDIGCGCGYGTYIMAEKVRCVCGYDNSEEAIEYAFEHYIRNNIGYYLAEFPDAMPAKVGNVSVCFETIEHIENPLQLLKNLRKSTEKLFASVPNQDKLPFKKEKFPFHHRHYTKFEFCELLSEAGWKPINWYGQENAWSDVKENINGRTLVVECV